MPGLTPFQTAGPFLSLGLRAGLDRPPAPADDVVVIEGRLLDGRGEGVSDGVLEFWQADRGLFRRVLTGPDGGFRLDTWPSPYITVLVMGRGILTRYWTRLYLEDAEGLHEDRVLQLVPVSRRATLVAHKRDQTHYHFDVILQGERETVFFDV